MAALEREERQIKEENIRLQRRLLLEQERRENLGRQLSESESSLEMEDERYSTNVSSTFSSRILCFVNNFCLERVYLLLKNDFIKSVDYILFRHFNEYSSGHFSHRERTRSLSPGQ